MRPNRLACLVGTPKRWPKDPDTDGEAERAQHRDNAKRDLPIKFHC